MAWVVRKGDDGVVVDERGKYEMVVWSLMEEENLRWW